MHVSILLHLRHKKLAQYTIFNDENNKDFFLKGLWWFYILLSWDVVEKDNILKRKINILQ